MFESSASTGSTRPGLGQRPDAANKSVGGNSIILSVLFSQQSLMLLVGPRLHLTATYHEYK